MTQIPPNAQTLKTRAPEIIDLFTLDITLLLPPGSVDQAIYRFCNWTQVGGSDVVYQGETYIALPMESSGFSRVASGQLERPALTFSNVGLVISGLTNTYTDLVGATVSRIRTMTTYLDGQPNADPNAFWGPEEWVVEQKASENKLQVTFQLTVPFDLEGQTLPSRRLLREQCQWIYRSNIGCHYVGSSYFDVNDNPVGTLGQDVCGKRLDSCRLRFPSGRLPFGGFPGLQDSQG